MKTLLLVLLVLLVALSAPIGCAQSARATVKLPYGAVLCLRQARFQASRHKLGYYQPAGQNKTRTLKTIDGQGFFGTDGGVPRSQLVSASLLLGGVYYQLPVGCMYSPWPYGYEPDARFFRLQRMRQPPGYLLWAEFSDGAGSYAAKWLISGSKARRILLSNSEEYFFR